MTKSVHAFRWTLLRLRLRWLHEAGQHGTGASLGLLACSMQVRYDSICKRIRCDPRAPVLPQVAQDPKAAEGGRQAEDLLRFLGPGL